MLFENRAFLAIMSVLCAIFLWYNAYTSFGVEDERTVANVPVNINTADIYERYGLEIIEIVSPDELKDRTMDVNIISKTPMLRSCSAEDFSIVADAGTVTQAGTYQLDLRITCTNPDLNIAVSSDNQKYITVRFDRVKSKNFPISNIVLNGDLTVAEGYTMESAFSNITDVTLTGPEILVNKIDSVAVAVHVDSMLKSTVIYEGELVFYDSEMNVIEDHTLSNDVTGTILVTVPVKMTKTVKTTVSFNNKPEGFGDKIFTISPSSLTFKGSQEALEQAFADTDSISVGTVDFSTVNSSNPTFTFEISPGSGVEVAEKVDSVTVTLKLGDIHTKTFEAESSTSVFNVINDKSGKAEVITKKLDQITVCGPLSQLKSISEKDFTVSADLSDKESYKGNCVVPAVITVSGHDKCWVYGNYEIEVKIPD